MMLIIAFESLANKIFAFLNFAEVIVSYICIIIVVILFACYMYPMKEFVREAVSELL